jgi:class 3 adenylate cyclase
MPQDKNILFAFKFPIFIFHNVRVLFYTIMKSFWYALVFLFIILLPSCSNSSNYRHNANNGQIDLSDWDFEQDGMAALNGTWEFYWGRLYTPLDFRSDSLKSKPYYLKVPGLWNSLNLPASGFGTYRLIVKLKEPYHSLGIRIPDISSSYSFWINNELVATNGRVSHDPTEIIPELNPQVKIFTIDSQQVELVVQVANNFHHKAGIWESLWIGTPGQVIALRERSLMLSVFFAGTVFILFIYNLWIYLFRKNEKAALWFGILCFIVLIRTFQINDRIINIIFPALSQDLRYRFEYLVIFCLIPVTFTLYYYYLFEISKLKGILKLICGMSVLTGLFILFAPTPLYTSLTLVFQVILYSIFIYFFILTFNQVAGKKKGARLLMLSWVVILVCGLNDILYLNLVINTTQVSHYGFFIFLLTQAYILAYKLAGAFQKVEDLTVNLEVKVAHRTHELEEEKKKSDNLLLNILPEEVAEELKQKGHTDAKTFSMVTVMFTDFKDFTRVSERVSGELLVSEINHCFSAFDEIVEKYNIEKIKTVGDAYICAGGLPVLSFTHAEDIVNAAIEMRDYMMARRKEKEARGEISFEIRLGVHTGPVVAGVVGTKKFAYDIWGDTVNIAARMESGSEAGKVNISGATWQLVKDKFNCLYRGKIQAKNKGEIDMYFVERKD